MRSKLSALASAVVMLGVAYGQEAGDTASTLTALDYAQIEMPVWAQ